MPKEKMKKILQEYNLKVIGSHTPLEQLENNLDETLKYNEYIGNKNIVIPWDLSIMSTHLILSLIS